MLIWVNDGEDDGTMFGLLWKLYFIFNIKLFCVP